MDNIGNNDANRLLSLLDAELNDFQKLIKDMAIIDSPYKNEFNYMRILVNQEKFKNDLEGKLNLLIEELNTFGKIYAKIVEDDEASQLYVKAGLLDKSLDLQKRILSKIS
ncbi:TPA: hypothetical protein ACG2L8_000634 [Legionella pneumophila]|nr:hypothetical protein [Legionella pneumophila]HAT2065481.1 hypothetical protein [Legionella pneumophila]HAT8591974.1 hypothetical protein [Legionella pneumophila]HAU1575712.1 hypothetical protein [Legionella pneumophila]HAU1679719.1 hypothetical protein [Legionella pneumophila]HAU3699398.1 hypothetical protein [Legionella pneumophila]